MRNPKVRRKQSSRKATRRRRNRDRSLIPAAIESLENRTLLAAQADLNEFFFYGNQSVRIDRGSEIDVEGLIGSARHVAVERDATTGGIRSGRTTTIERSVEIDGDLVGQRLFVARHTVVRGNIDAETAVFLDRNVVTEGDIVAGNWLFVGRDSDLNGSVGANRFAWLGSGTSIGQNVTVPDPDRDLFVGPNVGIGGEIISGYVDPDKFDGVTLPAPISYSTDPLNDIRTRHNVATTLAPGAYGDLKLGRNNTLYLSSGKYYFDQISVSRDLDLHFDVTSGAVDIFVRRDADIDRGLDVFFNGVAFEQTDPQLAQSVYVETRGDFKLDRDSEWAGSVYSSHDDVRLGRNVTFAGSFLSRDKIDVGREGIGQFVLADRFLAPRIDAHLAADTGADPTDTITSQFAVAGSLTDANQITQLRAGYDSTPVTDFFNVPFDAVDGSFLVDAALLNSLGINLVDGDHTLHVQAVDEFGNVSDLFGVSFTLDTIAPTTSIDGPTEGLHTNQNVTASGESTDSLSGLFSLQAQIDGGALLDVSFDSAGAYHFDTNFQLDSSADGPHTIVVRATDLAGNVSTVGPVEFVLDTIPPAAPEFDLSPESDSAPLGDQVTVFEFVTIEGTTESGATVSLLETGEQTQADAFGGFTFVGVALALGDNPFTVRAIDRAGNSSDFSQTLRRVTPGLAFLAEGSQFVAEATLPVELGQEEGSRTIRVEFDAQFDDSAQGAAIEDVFAIYLVDPANPTQTILDRGTPGTALFTLAGDTADFPPGLVRFDGTSVEIDVTSLGEHTDGLLLFQLLNSDTDERSIVTITDVSSVVDPDGDQGPVFPTRDDLATTGEPLELSQLTQSSDVTASLRNLRFDASSGNYTAEFQVVNNGPQLGRRIVLLFDNLPVGVDLVNPSGLDTNGNPYVSFRNAIDAGGLQTGASSRPIELTFTNPSLTRFSVAPTALTGGPNRAPDFAPIESLTVMPGGHLELPLSATDPDGDPVAYRLLSNGPLPTGRLTGDGRLIFTPTLAQVGSYGFEVVATDGAAETAQPVSLDVLPDPVTTTRLSGFVLNTNGDPLAGIPIELGDVQVLTGADGSFLLETTTAFTSDTLIVRGENFAGPEVYPFIAEKLPLLLPNELFTGVNNVVARPIYLPALDVAGGTTINPSQNTTVTQEIASGEFASVFVQSGTLLDQSGNPFNGILSITEVPRDLTPATLPQNLIPDTVVTIQPGEMVFTQPAPLTLPNRAGWEPGTLMDLWSINPTTGLFDNVGTGRVSADGTIISTETGGIRNSSWHLFTPPEPAPLAPDLQSDNQNQTCDICEALKPGTSEVELHSGAVRDSHELVSYQALGEDRGLTIHYNSQRSDASPIVHLGMSNVNGSLSNRFLVARLSFTNGAFTHQIPGSASGQGLPGGEHFWTLPSGTNDVKVALQADLRSLPTGVYDYTINVGSLLLGNTSDFNGTMDSVSGQIVHVNASDSLFGAGWQMAGVQRIFERNDGTVLLVDGNGETLVFESPTSAGNAYGTPIGDFTKLIKNGDGSFTRTTTDKTVFQFDSNGRLRTITDRNQNMTTHVYDNENLVRIIDAVGLETVFAYQDGRVKTITDPVGRVTTLEFDFQGNLSSIIDPDDTRRRFEYDARHRMTAETDQAGRREQINYGFHGRAVSSIRKDGKTLTFSPAQTRLIRPHHLTSELGNAPQSSVVIPDTIALASDGNGNVTRVELDSFGQSTVERDSIGNSPRTRRNDENDIDLLVDSRGFQTEFIYDDVDNIVRISDQFARRGSSDQLLVPGSRFNVGSYDGFVATGDFDGDGLLDLAKADGPLSVLLGNGDGSFSDPVWSSLFVIDHNDIVVADFNSDGMLDIATASPHSQAVVVYLGNGDGSFATDARFFAPVGLNPTSMSVGDFDGDGTIDVAVVDSSFGNGPSILLGLGDGRFSPFTSLDELAQPFDVVTGDFSGDGFDDLVVTNFASDTVSYYMSNGNGNFAARQLLPVAFRPYSLVAEDLDHDGSLDLAVASNGGQLSIILGNGNGTFLPRVEYNFISFGRPLVSTGDFDGDEAVDLAVATAGFGDISVLIGNGDGTFQERQRIDAGFSFGSTATSDLNGDGLADIIGGSFFSAEVAVFLGNGRSSSQPVEFTYDDTFNQLTSITDELGRQTLFEIDPVNGNTLSMTQIVGLPDSASSENDDIVTSFTYTTHGLLDTQTDALGRVTDFDYDLFGRLVKMTFAAATVDEASQTFAYDLAGNVTAITDENGNLTTLEYDLMNRLRRIVEADPDGAGPLSSPVTEFSYDNRGNLVETIDARRNKTVSTFDEMDQATSLTDADGNITRFRYDGNGNVVGVVDPLGRTTRNRYDGRNRLIETIDPDGGSTKFQYDSNDNLIFLTDPNGNRTQFAYDARNRLVREVDPLGNEILNVYDAADNLIRRIDRNERVIELFYDDLDRLISERWVNPDDSTANTITFGYDKVDNLTSIVDDFSALSFIYDNRNRVATVDNAGTPHTPHVVLNYTYDGVGNVTSVFDTVNSIAGATTAYEFDGLNRMTQIVQSGGGVADKRVDLAYNELGQFAAINRFSDLAGTQLVVGTAYTYDDLNRLTDLRHSNTTSDVAFYEFTYDDASQITSITDVDGATTFNYDNRGQLTAADREDGANPDESYEYDANGNRVSSHNHGTGYVTGPGNRLLSDGTFNYEYDDEGNLLKRTEIASGDYREFEWDHRNRLIAITDFATDGTPTQRVEFSYDAFDRRISKQVDPTPLDSASLDEVFTSFIYDREDVLFDFVDNDGISGPASSELSQRYLHGPGVDQILAQEDGAGTVEWLLTDHVGTVRDIADAVGQVVNHIRYDAFGNVIEQSDQSVPSRFLFQSREYDSATGLFYFRARFYDSSIGRFVSEDIIGFGSNDQNLYRFVLNDPVRLVDPSGLDSMDDDFRRHLNQRRVMAIGDEIAHLENESQKLDEFRKALNRSPGSGCGSGFLKGLATKRSRRGLFRSGKFGAFVGCQVRDQIQKNQIERTNDRIDNLKRLQQSIRNLDRNSCSN